jgi:hypothetical protein
MDDNQLFIADLAIPADQQEPIIINLDLHSLQIAFANRQQVVNLRRDAWDNTGVYVLLGPQRDQQPTEIYVGKSGGGKQGVRGRIQTHISNPQSNANFPWWRAVLITRNSRPGWNSADIGYLEGRLARKLNNYPEISLRASRSDIDTSLGQLREANLEQFLPAIIAALRLAGLDRELSGSDRAREAQKAKTKGTAAKSKARKGGWTRKDDKTTISDLLAAGILAPGAKLVFRDGAHFGSGEVSPDGQIVVSGQRYQAPSTAGRAICGRPNNGWTCWSLANDPKVTLSQLRKQFNDGRNNPGSGKKPNGNNKQNISSSQVRSPANKSEPSVIPGRKKNQQHWAQISDLLAAGLLAPGAELIYRRAGKEVRGRVTDQGEIVVNGHRYQTPSAAGKAIHGGAINGWFYWLTANHPQTRLAVLRERCEENS